jgi:twitching motility protein PilT
MAFDEEGQAATVERKVEICSRAYRILTEEIGFPGEDVIFDPNILTVATGMEEHDDYAVAFIEATRQIKQLMPLAKVSSGMLLVTGKTGSGKSTTLAAMIDDINSRLKGHILTIEDPIEFVHPRKNCLISQREIGAHAASFASALLSALREDPDVILVGELRDLETISTAITAAEMGILVMATLHTNGAAATVDRIVNAFPADKQSHVRTMLSTSLRGVVSQQLVSRKGAPGRVAALEVLVNTPAAANLIRQGKIDQLESTMQAGAAAGMRTMDSAIEQLLEQGLISGRSAYEKAINKTRFEQLREQD